MNKEEIQKKIGTRRRQADALQHLVALMDAGFPVEILDQAREKAMSGETVLPRYNPIVSSMGDGEDACMQVDLKGHYVSWSDIVRLFGGEGDEVG